MTLQVTPARVDPERLRLQVQAKYSDVALTPEAGFHFHTGAPLARMLGYSAGDLAWLPTGTVESFAGTGNPFSMGNLRPGETVLEVGCGAGFDALLAARQVGLRGRVVAIDMTEAMREKAQRGAQEKGLANVQVLHGYAEELSAADGSIDAVISNGVINLTPDKGVVMREVYRVLKPGGRIQIADIVVHREVPQDAKDDIDLWSG
jgi:SAM-dependent methyltransferase